MPKREEPQSHDAWASFRFAIVGPLLARPPSARGELLRALFQLAQTSWRHPITGEPVKFAVSTIERWFSAESTIMRRLRRPPCRGAARIPPQRD